jgi:hypothetical protein
LDAPLIPMDKNAITLKTAAGKDPGVYQLLSHSHSGLRDEYYLLSRKSRYQVLGHYSWKQPANHQGTVALPHLSHNGWEMQGTLRVQEGSYYTFDADLQCSPPNNPKSSFTVSQKQRLKDNVVYYLDHSQIGMVVKIHR